MYALYTNTTRHYALRVEKKTGMRGSWRVKYEMMMAIRYMYALYANTTLHSALRVKKTGEKKQECGAAGV
jgi:hypothetical protein